MKKFLLKIWYSILAETPKLSKAIAKLSITIPVLVTAINLATSNTVVPNWYTQYQFYILGGCAIVSFFFATRTTEDGKQKIADKLNS